MHELFLPSSLPYIDYVILTSSFQALLHQLTEKLKWKFPMSNIGRLQYFLGGSVDYSASRTMLSKILCK